MRTRVYPADARGYCLRGFCPTICKSIEKAQREALELEFSLRKYGFKYHHIVIEEA
jgi:hypothetical protein